MLEAEVSKSVSNRLGNWQMSGEVVYYLRVNSGKVKNTYTNSWIQLAQAGHPDFICIVRNKQRGLDLLFIEIKRPGIKCKLSPDQIKFQNKYKNVQNTHYLVVDHPDYVDFYINDIAFDKVTNDQWGV